jgi:hypothetical protein
MRQQHIAARSVLHERVAGWYTFCQAACHAYVLRPCYTLIRMQTCNACLRDLADSLIVAVHTLLQCVLICKQTGNTPPHLHDLSEGQEACNMPPAALLTCAMTGSAMLHLTDLLIC